MAQYLSDEWFEEMQDAAAAYVPSEATESRVSMRETVTGTPVGDVSYVMTIHHGKVSIDRDGASNADVTFTQDYTTAAALHRGETTTQEAFFAGKVKVAGHLNTLLDNSEALLGISEVFADVRADTTYEG